ncbi:hypothetical protein CIG19_01570 [Enterobacterales bacterium CwR94]|nr:hypothetical protein CIG19_01570 [Enterobacterales bacterium CwR94]
MAYRCHISETLEQDMRQISARTKMKIQLEADYKSHTRYVPIYRLNGQLIAVSMSTYFIHATANVVAPQEIVRPQLSLEQRAGLLMSQLTQLESLQHFFIQHRVQVGINIDADTADIILSNDIIWKKMCALSFIELEIREDYPNLQLGRAHPQLGKLSEIFTLSLGNFGAGKTSPTSIYEGLYSRIKLDPVFVQRLRQRPALLPFMRAIIENIAPYCHEMVIPAIDEPVHLEQIRHLAIDGICGDLFPSASSETLSELIPPPRILTQDA